MSKDDLKKFSPGEVAPGKLDHDAVAATPKPVGRSFGGANWLGNHSYPLVKPQHADELEKEAAINEFGNKMARRDAEDAAHASYKKRQHTEAAAHHLAGMKAADAAGDKESARKHSLMYDLHSKGMGHEPVGPAHADVVALMGKSKVYKFKPHHGDQLVLSGDNVQKSSESEGLGKAERDALSVIWQACQALQKAEAKKGEVVGAIGKPEGAKPQPAVSRDDDLNVARAKRFSQESGLDDMPKAKPQKKSEPRSSRPAPCVCDAYAHSKTRIPWPHRKGGGKCKAE